MGTAAAVAVDLQVMVVVGVGDLATAVVEAVQAGVVDVDVEVGFVEDVVDVVVGLLVVLEVVVGLLDVVDVGLVLLVVC